MKSLQFIQPTLSLLGIMIISTQAMATPDYAREQRWADQVVPEIFYGDPVYLQQKNKHKFLGLYSEADNNAVAVIVVHGMGLHPDWGVIGTLRQDLYEFGYTTLSIQMPILASGALPSLYPPLFPEAAERLELAVNFLKKKGNKYVVIVSHSNGSRMSRVYMSNNPADVSAWVALSLTQGETFEGINAPIFDLYGEEDLPHVLLSVTERKNSLVNSESQQKFISEANHFFKRKEKIMINEVKMFLTNLIKND